MTGTTIASGGMGILCQEWTLIRGVLDTQNGIVTDEHALTYLIKYCFRVPEVPRPEPFCEPVVDGF